MLRASPDGTLELFALAGRVAQSGALTASDAALWLPTWQQGGGGASLTKFLPDTGTQDFVGAPSCGRIVSAVADRGGMVWYVSEAGALGCQPRTAVGRRQPNGELAAWPLPDGMAPRDIELAADGGVWVLAATQTSELAVLRVSARGETTAFLTGRGASHQADLVVAPDGRPWFTAEYLIGRLTEGGGFEYQSAHGLVGRLTVGPDGALWALGGDSGQLTRLNLASGDVCSFPLPTRVTKSSPSGALYRGLTAGPDGNIWYIASQGGIDSPVESVLGRFTIDASVRACEPVNRHPTRSDPATKKPPRYVGRNKVRAARGRTRLLRFGRSSPRGGSGDLSLSGSGRYLAFSSSTRTLTSRDYDGTSDVFIYDRSRRRITLASRAHNSGRPARGNSSQPSISADGTQVAFTSTARNLTASGSGKGADVFLFSRRSGRVRLVSAPHTGGWANGPSDHPVLSANGRFVAFWSAASNLVRGDNNNAADVFVRDLVTGKIRLVSLGPSGRQQDRAVAPLLRELAISARGERVAFVSSAKNLAPNAGRLPQVYLRDLRRGTTTLISAAASGVPDGPSSEPRISADGRKVIYSTRATNPLPRTPLPMGGILLHDTDRDTRVPVALDAAGKPLRASYAEVFALSPSGRHLLFSTVSAQALTGGVGRRHQVLLRDLVEQTTEPVSVSSTGRLGNANSRQAVMSRNARVILFTSNARNLVRGAPGGRSLIYLRARR